LIISLIVIWATDK